MLNRQRPVWFYALAVLPLTLAIPASGQQAFGLPALASAAMDSGPAAPATTTAPPAAVPPAEKRAENAELLRLAQRKLESAGATDAAATQQVAHYQSLLAVLAQQELVDQQIKDLAARKVELANQLKSAATEGDQAAIVHSFVELDQLKDDLASEEARASLVDDRFTSAKAALEKAQRAWDECEVKRRQTQEAAEVGKKAANSADLANTAEQARQAATLAAETVTLRKREVEREKLFQEVQRLAVRICQEQVARVSPLVKFTDADLQEQLAQIKQKEDSANRSLARAQNSLHAVNRQVKDVQQQLQAEASDHRVPSGWLTEKLEAQRSAREKLTDEIDSLTQRQARLAQLRVAWSRRYEIAASNSSHAQPSGGEALGWGQLKEWQKETQAILDELAADLRTQITSMRTLRSSLTSLTKKVDAAKESAAKATAAGEVGESPVPWMEMQRSQVEAMLRIHETNLVTIETSRRVHEKLLEELGRGVSAMSPKTIALGAWHQAAQFWNLEITSINDNPITIRKIVTGIVLFVGGWIASRFLSGLFAYRLLGRFRLSKDGTAAIRTLVFYLLLIIVVLAALRTVNVPLTAFTILGGALAIGVGFGSQALINNFIGGLIMLAERPVRLGERITFGQYDGTVEDVGFRCTKLRTMTDHLVTIPNSTLVNESIENITRRRTIRRLMNVTITYDTPRDKVAAAVQAIRDILEEKETRERIHPIVGFEEFPPRVFFNDYNAESLNILVLYWYAPSDNWWAYVEHCEHVNFRIMEEFERLGVEFAFPSRTVYLVNQDKRAATFEPARKESKSRGAA